MFGGLGRAIGFGGGGFKGPQQEGGPQQSKFGNFAQQMMPRMGGMNRGGMMGGIGPSFMGQMGKFAGQMGSRMGQMNRGGMMGRMNNGRGMSPWGGGMWGRMNTPQRPPEQRPGMPPMQFPQLQPQPQQEPPQQIQAPENTGPFDFSKLFGGGQMHVMPYRGGGGIGPSMGFRAVDPRFESQTPPGVYY